MIDAPIRVSKPTIHMKLPRKRIFFWVVVGVCLVGLLLSLLISIFVQFTHPGLAPRLILEQDIPLPGAFPDAYRTSEQPVAPGLSVLFDHFDFMGLDPHTHLLFIAHSGPAPDREQQVNPKFNPETDAKYDGNVIVFDTLKKKVVAVLDIPQGAGVVVAPDLAKVYVADANDNIIYAINEHTLKYSAIPLQDNDSPDGITYDQADHLIAVSNPGTPPNADTNIIARKNQNETFIDALTDKVVARVPLGIDGQWGDDVGHVKFDSGLHRFYVAVQQLADPNSLDPNLLPPPGTAWLVAIDPATFHVASRMKLPNNCITPHGMTIDTALHIAFIACVDEDPPSLIRVDLQSMRVFPEAPWPVALKPDIVVLDSTHHLLYVACGAGIALFQEQGRALKWLGTYPFGVSTHTLAVNEQTQEIYLPLIRQGNRPVLRILRYNPNANN